MLTSTLQDRLRRASALTGLEPAEMVRCAISEWLQRLEQPPLPFASAAPLAQPKADPEPPAPTPAPVPGATTPPNPPKKRGRRPRSAGKEGNTKGKS